MFDNDVNKYYQYFLKTAPEEIKNEYIPIIENYFERFKQDNTSETTNNSENEALSSIIVFIIIFMVLLILFLNF